jgi:hypothetical protein
MKGLVRSCGKVLPKSLRYGAAGQKIARRTFVSEAGRGRASTSTGGGLTFPIVDHHYE